MNKLSFNTKLGYLTIFSNGKYLTSITYANLKGKSTLKILLKTKYEILKYLDGKLKKFTIPLKPKGSPFLEKAWQQLLKIPYGITVSYQDIARKIHNHPRGIGIACRKNPIPIIIPCHRIIAKSGNLTGYSGGQGIITKQKLLLLEGVNNVNTRPTKIKKSH